MYTKKWYFTQALLWLAIVGVILIILLNMNGCSAQGDVPMHPYKFTWEANTEPDMDHYTIYAWNGSDTTQTPFVAGTASQPYEPYILKDHIPHIPGTPVMRDTIDYVANGNWLHFALAAVDVNGNRSTIAVSNFLKSDDMIAPGEPKNFGVQK